MLLLAFSRSESRYSCDISSSLSSSELSSPSDSESDSEDECSDEDGSEDEDDAEGEREMSPRSTESEGSNLPFPFSWAESVILEDIDPDAVCSNFPFQSAAITAREPPYGVGSLVRLALRWGIRGREHTII